MDQHKPPQAAAPAKSNKNKLLKFLPRATSAVSFNPPLPFSPAKDKRSLILDYHVHHQNTTSKTHKSHLGVGFSGPMVSMIPAEARRKTKNSTYVTQEPTSPKVSCMGQIKCKHMQKDHQIAKTKQPKKVSRTSSFPVVRNEPEVVVVAAAEKKTKKKSGIRSIFGGGRKSDASNNRPKVPSTATSLDKAPSLSQMKRFASGRETFTSFDWTTQVAPMESDNRSYEDSDEESNGEEEEEAMIPFSAPILRNGSGNRGLVNNLEPRKEINLWKRRTMAQPKPLQLHTNKL